jgi:multidrug efflux pump subunit AcrA (membrane-fusion protein)
MMPPTTVVVIDDLSIIEVRVRVPELKLREIDAGSTVGVYFPALDERREVPITRLGNSVDPHTRTIELIIEVANENLRIKSGMSVEVELGRKSAPAPTEAAPTEAAPTQAQPTAMVTPPKDKPANPG